ncbi:MAG: hypothetical protein HPY57_13440 [Ignavibacteria bacterium]|nr:hypothetical protein [Ignavibacteria bacterium]
METIGFFKKWKLLFQYIKTIKKHTKDIKNYFLQNSYQTTYKIKDMNYDRVYRFYTVINLLPEIEENVKRYGYQYFDNETKKFIKELNLQFKKYGLMELVGLSRADQIGPTNILVVVEFKFLKTVKIARNLIALILLLIAGAIVLFIL